MQTVSFDSPAELLASLSIQPVDAHRLLLVSGPRQAGKTHWCMRLVEQARSFGLEVAGLLSLAVFEGGQKVRIDLLDLATEVRRCLAIRKVEIGDHLIVGAWEFDPEVLEWGNAQLGAIRHCQLLVVDELGPLEFENHAGWMNAFPAIESRCYQLACLVVRPELLPQALERWPWAQVYKLPARLEIG